jgi:hypothetical protein
VAKTYIAKDELFIRGREQGEYIHPGDTVELDESRAAVLLERKLIEEAPAKAAAKNQEAK